MENNKIEELIEEAEEIRSVGDGIYDVSNLEYIEVEEICGDYKKDVINFIRKYPNFYYASAYETNTVILLSDKPIELNIPQIGGFNYGTTAVLDNCPKTLLILAEND